jgi:pyruvate dehydrogenase E2 component (dihydrolipoamide acetyltransferase)
VIDRPNGNHSNGKVLAAPAVRRLARDQGLDLTSIHGTGRDGHVTRADVEAALAAVSASKVAEAALEAEPASDLPLSAERHEVPLSQMRRAIARRLVQSAQEAPHFYVTAELDLTHALSVLPKDIGINNLLLYLTVQTLKDSPDLNATYEDDHLYHYAHINLVMAIALPNGLITPVLYQAEDYSLTGLANRARDLIARTREGKLRRTELSGGTFTISNLGMVNQIERFTAIINPPQVGILAVGAAKDRPVVIDGGLHIRKTVHLTLSADHRIVDGLIAARFLEIFDQHLQTFSG